MTDRFVRLHAGGRWWSLPVLSVRSIAPHRPCIRIPLAPPEVLGLDLYEGRLLTVIELEAVFGQTARTPAPTALRLLLAPPFAHLALVLAERPVVGDPSDCEPLDPLRLVETIEARAGYGLLSA